MTSYHDYVFDKEKRKFLGQFENMYANEVKDNYDSWHQEDLNRFQKVFSLAIMGQYNFDTILDIGCGKGCFTNMLKKRNNVVTGIDLSNTAINRASAKYPDISFKVFDVSKENIKDKYNLVVMMEVLSYLEDWKEIIKKVSLITDYIFIGLYLPENPIGFIKNFNDLVNEIKKYFTVEVDNFIINEDCRLILGRKI